MTTETQAPAGRRLPGRRSDDFASLFPELYRSAFTAAYSELGSRSAAEEITHATLARAHARWARISDAPVGWVSMTARTQALHMLHRQPPGREVLLDGEEELPPGEIPDPAPGDLAAVTRRSRWLRRRRAAGWAAAGMSVVAAAILAVGLGNWMPPERPSETPVAAAAGPLRPDYSPIRPGPRHGAPLFLGRISAGSSEQGSVRIRFEQSGRQVVMSPTTGEILADSEQDVPAQLVIDPAAALETRDHTRADAPLVTRTPEELVQTLNRSTPGGQTEVWIRLGPDGKVTALREE